MNFLKRYLKRLPYAFTTWITARDGRRVRIGVPVGMTVGDLENQLHERYWSAPDLSRKEPQRCAECDCKNGGDECNWIAQKEPE